MNGASLGTSTKYPKLLGLWYTSSILYFNEFLSKIQSTFFLHDFLYFGVNFVFNDLSAFLAFEPINCFFFFFDFSGFDTTGFD